MNLIKNKNLIYFSSLFLFVFLSIIFHLLIPSEFRDQRTKVDLISFLLFSIILFIKIIYFNWKFNDFFKSKLLDLFSYIIILLISYILFYVFLINNILAISIIFLLYISILIDSSINIKDIIKFTKNENQILDYF